MRPTGRVGILEASRPAGPEPDPFSTSASMKTFLLRIMVAVVVASGILTAVAVVRMAGVQAPPRPEGGPHPFAFPEAEAVERLAGAVRIRTVSTAQPTPEERYAWPEMHAYLVTAFPRVHAALRRETVSDFSLLFTWEGSDPELRPVLFAGHLDVVPAPEETLDDWTHPPFAGTVADGYVWGRGTLDMKGPSLAILEAVEALLAAGFEPRRTILLAFGHDEEVGGEEGGARIAALLAERETFPEWVLDEGGALSTGTIPGVRDPVGLVGTAEKAYMTFLLEARAEAGHASAPPPVTAIGTLARAVARLEENPFPPRLAGPSRELLETLAPHMDPGTRLLATNLWLLGPVVARALGAEALTGAMVRTTLAPTIVVGGERENVLPSRADAVVNARLAPWDSVGSVMARVGELTAGLDVDVTVVADWAHGSGGPPVSSTASAGYRLIREATLRVFPDVIEVAPYLTLAATDGRHYQPVADDVYRFAPFRADPTVLERIHGVDERVAVGEYLGMVRFYGELVRRAAEGEGD